MLLPLLRSVRRVASKWGQPIYVQPILDIEVSRWKQNKTAGKTWKNERNGFVAQSVPSGRRSVCTVRAHLEQTAFHAARCAIAFLFSALNNQCLFHRSKPNHRRESYSAGWQFDWVSIVEKFGHNSLRIWKDLYWFYKAKEYFLVFVLLPILSRLESNKISIINLYSSYMPQCLMWLMKTFTHSWSSPNLDVFIII